MKKKQMMMALVSLMVLSAQAQANFQVSVSNPSKVARTDAPVVVDLSKLGAIGNIQRAVVTVDGKEIPSQLDDTNRDCTNDELCFLADLGKKETKTYQVHLYREGEQAQYPARTFAELCLPSRNRKLAKNRQDIYLRSISFDKKTKDPYHYVHSHGICFESELIAMRVYFDHRQTIDLYGKINKGLVVQDTQFYPSEEQIQAGSGDDCLWVGNTYGLGALRGCWFSYISPLLQMEGGFSAASISLLMILAGGGMVVGNQVSALLADRFKPGRFTCYLQFLAAAALLLTFFLAPFGWVSVVLMFICCTCLFGIGSPEQFLIVKHAKGGEMLGGCCIQGAFNLGNAMGAFLGGIPVAMRLGYNFPALIGVPMALAGAICLLVFHKKYE